MLQLKATHKVVRAYFTELNSLAQLGFFHEGAVAPAFANILRAGAQPFGWTLTEQYQRKPGRGRTIRIDGALLDNFKLAHGYWEAKDSDDDLDLEIRKKLAAGYPQDNILFQAPYRMVVIQQGQRVWDSPIEGEGGPDALIEGLRAFFNYQPPAYERWQQAVEEFKTVVPDLAEALLALIEGERQHNLAFRQAFASFTDLCKQAINPDISDEAVKEMLIQHLLTERIFRRVFNTPDFVTRNVIAREIDTVVQALTSQRFNRHEFFRPLDRFYRAIETTAETIEDYAEKQGFLNTVYENFFQGFAVKMADTHGIVYTPQPIVDFMVRSVETILDQEFGRSLADDSVHVLDPFVGTGNFILRVMRHLQEIGKLSCLPDKYAHELHCNEIMLLPYYIASMNIEHEYYELTEKYVPFRGICLVDTFDLAEDRQLPLFVPENTKRVENQKDTPMVVIIGNPPYNAGQVNENDNNKNRTYETMNKQVRKTYAKDSKATLKNSLYDPYVKAIRWAADRIGEREGIIAFVTNNSFIDGMSFDGMRKHLAEDFDALYILDLGGNARKGLAVSDANVFGIRVGVSINLFVKTKSSTDTRIYYYRTDDLWDKKRKFNFLQERPHVGKIEWQTIQPDKRYTWLTEGLHAEFETFIPMGTKEAKAAKGAAVDVLFHTFSNGVKTNRDAWAYHFNRSTLTENMERMIDFYNEQMFKWDRRTDQDANVDEFVVYDDKKIKWSHFLKLALKRGKTTHFSPEKVRKSLWRPFTRSNLYFARMMNDVVSLFPSIFPTAETEEENRVIIVSDHGFRADFSTLMTNLIPDLHSLSARDSFQCFPFYIYDEDGSNRRENITNWALAQFRRQYQDESISKWDIFHYVYALLHHPGYRERYQANLKRDLPHVPLAPQSSDFWAFAKAGARLADIHVGYEEMPAYPLTLVETPGQLLNWRVEKMKLSKDKKSIRYNDFLTLEGIPEKAFSYRLGNRSALEWVLDQYRVKVDKRSGIVNDPNRVPGKFDSHTTVQQDEQYIVKLLQKVITVSLETVEIVESLPAVKSDSWKAVPRHDSQEFGHRVS